MKVAVYVRVSTEDQADRGTIENQIIFAEKYCDLHSLEVFKVYKEEGISGTIPLHERPEGKYLIEDAKNKLFDTLLVYKLDRLGRSARVTLNSLYELENYGIQIKSMTEPFDTSNPSGRFMITMLAGVADLERETILERMWHGANRAARDGKWLGGIVPYGYIVDSKGYLEVNDSPLPGFDITEAEVIRMIFDLTVNQKYSSVKIANYLNALGIPSSYKKLDKKVLRGKRKESTAGIWRPTAIQRIIKSKTYMGIHEYGKRSNKKDREIITREVPGIIDSDTWTSAQNVLKENQIDAMRNSTQDYLLRGLIKCGCCGKNYMGITYKARNKNFYTCTSKYSYDGILNGKCASKNVPGAFIEELVWDDILHFIYNPGEVVELIRENLEDTNNKITSLKRQKDQLQVSINTKEEEKQSILDLFRRKIISATDVEKQLSKINDELLVNQELVIDLDKQINSQSILEQKFNSVELLLATMKEKIENGITFKDKRDIVKTLVKRIDVYTIEQLNGRKSVDIKVKYSFTKDSDIVQGVNHTDRGLMLLPT
ncbi:recombinase family protein [Clostridium swellfunianum]|uniref:recombinase family protein n=1 Tax=Clostridium swellfunianum TaxID=1367462 RepID=UPI00202F5090|nr:recombinase family protein [Clostridium swellfunianum]MCM0648688.1 recombinase family protein [Clostridium swellfunianum]